jgi:hypothetical protein
MLIPPLAVERAMQIKEVLLRAMNKEYSWLRAAKILGITARGLRFDLRAKLRADIDESDVLAAFVREAFPGWLREKLG